MKLIHNIQKLQGRRKELRKRSTNQEKILWEIIRNRKLIHKFRRQHSIGGYILDFYCPEKRLIIEIDGEIHNEKEQEEYDRVRDKFFKEIDFTVLRFSNSEIDKNLIKVIEKIKETLDSK